MLVIFNTLEKTSGAWPQIACNDSRGNPFCPREVGLNPLQWDKEKKASCSHLLSDIPWLPPLASPPFEGKQ